ncbi:AbrB/MazE/SpoVT family DNA-binding domain-containing protein [Patescibacteria group bacterium]|nr:AbrB/MazE/SpoVT family DNA-binding domain-containing protein [Patescibacteria group bacterium]
MEEKIIRKLTKVGQYSYSIVIPKYIVKRFGWRERQKLEFQIDDRTKKIVIKDYKKKK